MKTKSLIISTLAFGIIGLALTVGVRTVSAETISTYSTLIANKLEQISDPSLKQNDHGSNIYTN